MFSTHYSHKVMEEATKLVALDHNNNASRQQVRQKHVVFNFFFN